MPDTVKTVSKNTAYYTKTASLMILLTLESYVLTTLLLKYVKTNDFFTPPMKTLGILLLVLLSILYTYSLTVGSWGKWEQFIVVPAPISLGLFLGVFLLNPTYAVLIAVGAYLLISYDVLLATKIRDQMVYFDPRTVLRLSAKGFLFLYAVVASLMVFLHSANKQDDFDIGGKIGDIAQDQVANLIQPTLDSSNLPDNLQKELGEKGVSSSPELLGMLKNIPTFNLDLKGTVKTEVDNIIAPYKQFIAPLISLLVFALIRFVGTFAYLLFYLTVPILFAFAKQLNFLHVNHIPVEKESISFMETR